MTVGSTFAVVRQEITTDPDTKEVLDTKDTEIGRIKITEVRDGISIGSLVRGVAASRCATSSRFRPARSLKHIFRVIPTFSIGRASCPLPDA